MNLQACEIVNFYIPNYAGTLESNYQNSSFRLLIWSFRSTVSYSGEVPAFNVSPVNKYIGVKPILWNFSAMAIPLTLHLEFLSKLIGVTTPFVAIFTVMDTNRYKTTWIEQIRAPLNLSARS